MAKWHWAKRCGRTSRIRSPHGGRWKTLKENWRHNMNRIISVWLGVLALMSGLAFAHEQHAHVHGIASLQLAVDGNTLTLDLSSPLDNLLGFEHVPRTDKQKAAVHNMAERLRK